MVHVYTYQTTGKKLQTWKKKLSLELHVHVRCTTCMYSVCNQPHCMPSLACLLYAVRRKRWLVSTRHRSSRQQLYDSGPSCQVCHSKTKSHPNTPLVHCTSTDTYMYTHTHIETHIHTTVKHTSLHNITHTCIVTQQKQLKEKVW